MNCGCGGHLQVQLKLLKLPTALVIMLLQCRATGYTTAIMAAAAGILEAS